MLKRVLGLIIGVMLCGSASGAEVTNAFGVTLSKTILLGTRTNYVNIGDMLFFTTNYNVRLGIIESHTSRWDFAYFMGVDASNRLDIVEANTSKWNVAYALGVDSSNRLDIVEANTSKWNTAYWVSIDATNRLKFIESNTSKWDSAYNSSIDLSNRLTFLEINTSRWDMAYIIGIDSTNRLKYLESGTSRWNSAYDMGIDASNRLGFVEANTSKWNSAYVLGIDASNRLELVEAKTSQWYTAYVLSVSASNRLDAVDVRTSRWDNAYSFGVDALARLGLIEPSTSKWDTAYILGVDATNRLAIIEANTSKVVSVSSIYNPTNKYEWYEFRGDEKWTYTVDTVDTGVYVDIVEQLDDGYGNVLGVQKLPYPFYTNGWYTVDGGDAYYINSPGNTWGSSPTNIFVLIPLNENNSGYAILHLYPTTNVTISSSTKDLEDIKIKQVYDSSFTNKWTEFHDGEKWTYVVSVKTNVSIYPALETFMGEKFNVQTIPWPLASTYFSSHETIVGDNMVYSITGNRTGIWQSESTNKFVLTLVGGSGAVSGGAVLIPFWETNIIMDVYSPTGEVGKTFDFLSNKKTTELYDSANSNEWVEIRGNERWVYTTTTIDTNIVITSIFKDWSGNTLSPQILPCPFLVGGWELFVLPAVKKPGFATYMLFSPDNSAAWSTFVSITNNVDVDLRVSPDYEFAEGNGYVHFVLTTNIFKTKIVSTNDINLAIVKHNTDADSHPDKVSITNGISINQSIIGASITNTVLLNLAGTNTGSTATILSAMVPAFSNNVYALPAYSGTFAMMTDLQLVPLNVKVEEDGGIQAGRVVYICGGSGGNLCVKLSSCDNPSTLPPIGVAMTSGTKNSFIDVALIGPTPHIDTSIFPEGSDAYLGTNGVLSYAPINPTNALILIGKVSKQSASSGILFVNIKSYFQDGAYAGSMRYTVKNADNTATNSSANFYAQNNIGRSAHMGIHNTNHFKGPATIFRGSYGKVMFGNSTRNPFVWNIDMTDSGTDFPLWDYPVMALVPQVASSNAFLGIGTTNPLSMLDVRGNTDIHGSLNIEEYSDTNSPVIIPPVTPSVWNFISYATNTVIKINQNKRIYSVSVSAANTISNDLSALVFDGTKSAEWEVWVNYLTTNALSTVWDNRMDFGGSTPDLTVTGQYKIACSTIDGINIIAKQIYPTVYTWSSFPAFKANQNIPEYPVYWNEIIRAGFTTNYAMLFCTYEFNAPCLFKMSYYAYIPNGETNPITVHIGMGSTLSLPNATGKVVVSTNFFLLQNPPIGLFVQTTFWVDTIAKPNWLFNNPYIQFTSPYIGPRANFYRFSLKQANELEIKAHNAGWRP